MSAYRYIAQRKAQMPVRQLCQVLQVAPSAYYAWRRHSQRPVAEPAWQVAVRAAFAYHAQRYGTRRLLAEVQSGGPLAHPPRPPGTTQPPRAFVPRTTDEAPAVRLHPTAC